MPNSMTSASFPSARDRPLTLEVTHGTRSLCLVDGRTQVSPARSTRSLPLPLEITRLAGEYALPLAAPDLAGNSPRPEVMAPSGVPRSFTSLSERALEALNTGGRPASSWWQSRAGRIAQLFIVVTFIAAESSKHLLSVKALSGKGTVPVQTFIVLQGVASLLVATVLTAVLDGSSGLRAAYSPREAARCLPVAVGFSLSQTALALSFSDGLGAATVMVLGMLYMPLCAFLSRWVFRRHYGWLEVHALAFLTLTSMIFVELRCRADGISHSREAVSWCLASTVCSCFSSLFGERILKAKYTPMMPLRSFYVQKVWLEAGGLIVGIIALLLCALVEGWPEWVTFWAQWDAWMGVALSVRVAQSWLAGLLAKHLSTVARAVIQCVALLVVYVYVAVERGRGASSTTETFLALIVGLSALMYQIGRRMTEHEHASDWRLRDAGGVVDQVLVPAVGRSISDPTWRWAAGIVPPSAPRFMERFKLVRLTFLDTESAMLPEGHTLAPREFRVPDESVLEPGVQTESERNWMLDAAWLVQARTVNARLAEWASTRSGHLSQVMCILCFILSDACRTLIYASNIDGTPIVSQSLVVAASAASIPFGVALSAFLDGRQGVLTSLSASDALACLPVAACFSLGSTLQIKAYGAGISASVNVVLGYFYMPLSALLSRWVFRRAYGGLEWLALTLLSLAAVVFVLLRNDRSSSATSAEAMLCCFGSVIISCVGSLFAEKIMKSRPSPFYTQKVHLEVGGLFTAVAMLFIVGFTSTQEKDAFWKERDVGDGVMETGVFVGWTLSTLLALLATLLQSWLGGLVAKRLSTVVRSVAQCLSLLIIYFYGDLVLKAMPFDWVVGGAAVVVALSVQVFTLAGLRAKQQTERDNVAAVASELPTAPAVSDLARRLTT